MRLWPMVALTGIMEFISLGGILGGIAFLLDPSGGGLGMTTADLDGSPFQDYTIPGFFLLVMMGIYPSFMVGGLWARFPLPPLAPLERLFGQHWAWLGTISFALLLMVFMLIESVLLGQMWVQLVFAVLGVIIIFLTMWPDVRKAYRIGAGDGQA